MRPNILIVEDDLTSREIIKAGLRTSGYKLDVTNDGMAAYESALHNSLDLVFMDRIMPGWSGYETSQAFRFNQALTKISTIFVTSALN